jgi:hypothetical protein
MVVHGSGFCLAPLLPGFAWLLPRFPWGSRCPSPWGWGHAPGWPASIGSHLVGWNLVLVLAVGNVSSPHQVSGLSLGVVRTVMRVGCLRNVSCPGSPTPVTCLTPAEHIFPTPSHSARSQTMQAARLTPCPLVKVCGLPDGRFFKRRSVTTVLPLVSLSLGLSLPDHTREHVLVEKNLTDLRRNPCEAPTVHHVYGSTA